MSKNDDRILELKKQIKTKEEELAKKKAKFIAVTNCILIFENENYNINVLNEEQLILLATRINLYIMSAKELKLALPKFNGFELEDWITDIKNKLEVLAYKKEERELKEFQKKLDKLLSDEKRVELELDEIAASLA